eukprot:2258976-Prymnesium_polylepis.1
MLIASIPKSNLLDSGIEALAAERKKKKKKKKKKKVPGCWLTRATVFFFFFFFHTVLSGHQQQRGAQRSVRVCELLRYDVDHGNSYLLTWPWARAPAWLATFPCASQCAGFSGNVPK